MLYATHPRFWDHDTGIGHPERPSRLDAVERGIDRAGLRQGLVPVPVQPVAVEDLSLVHPVEYQQAIERFARAGGGYLDGDTHLGPASWEAARLAAGAGIELVRRLDAGEGSAGFCAVRPPGHHALPSRAMGFCLFNNVAVTAAHLAARGERVAIVDYDAHHGNGTEAAFWTHPSVFYISTHEWPMYPGTGHLRDVGEGAGLGTTMNLPFPSGTTGDVFRQAIDDLVLPALEQFEPSWLLISAGFDAHRQDPLTSMGLTSGDFADLTRVLCEVFPPGRRLLFLEGGYDLDALSDSTGAVLSALIDDGAYRPEPATDGGPGADVWRSALKIHRRAADG